MRLVSWAGSLSLCGAGSVSLCLLCLHPFIVCFCGSLSGEGDVAANLFVLPMCPFIVIFYCLCYFCCPLRGWFPLRYRNSWFLPWGWEVVACFLRVCRVVFSALVVITDALSGAVVRVCFLISSLVVLLWSDRATLVSPMGGYTRLSVTDVVVILPECRVKMIVKSVGLECL